MCEISLHNNELEWYSFYIAEPMSHQCSALYVSGKTSHLYNIFASQREMNESYSGYFRLSSGHSMRCAYGFRYQRSLLGYESRLITLE